MPAVLEVEIGSTARLECSFSIPGNASFTSVEWFYVSAVGLGGQPGAVPGALHQVRPPGQPRPLRSGEAVRHHRQRGADR